jgi:hypothetical protein
MQPHPLNVGRKVACCWLGESASSPSSDACDLRVDTFTRGIDLLENHFLSGRERYGNIVNSMFCLIYKEVYEMASEKLTSNWL